MVGLTERAVRATSFGAAADDYDRYRPGPPAAAVEWLLPPGARRAVDLGAGTGALSSLLTSRVREVVAVEIDLRMLAVLERRAPAARRIAGRAEAIPLAEATTDVVGIASAWHWMDEGRALLEIARVLRPGGVLGVLWSGPDRAVPWVADVLGASGRGSTSLDGAGASTRELHVSDLAFATPERRPFAASVRYRVADLVGLAASYSSMITLAEGERAEALAAVASCVADHPALRGRDEVELPLRCLCWRVERLQSAPTMETD